MEPILSHLDSILVHPDETGLILAKSPDPKADATRPGKRAATTSPRSLSPSQLRRKEFGVDIRRRGSGWHGQALASSNTVTQSGDRGTRKRLTRKRDHRIMPSSGCHGHGFA